MLDLAAYDAISNAYGAIYVGFLCVRFISIQKTPSMCYRTQEIQNTVALTARTIEHSFALNSLFDLCRSYWCMTYYMRIMYTWCERSAELIKSMELLSTFIGMGKGIQVPSNWEPRIWIKIIVLSKWVSMNEFEVSSNIPWLNSVHSTISFGVYWMRTGTKGNGVKVTELKEKKNSMENYIAHWILSRRIYSQNT